MCPSVTHLWTLKATSHLVYLHHTFYSWNGIRPTDFHVQTLTYATHNWRTLEPIDFKLGTLINNTKMITITLKFSGSSQCGFRLCYWEILYIYAQGRHEFPGLNKSSCFPTNWTINCLLYRKLKENLLSRKHALNRSFEYFSLSFSVSETWRAKRTMTS